MNYLKHENIKNFNLDILSLLQRKNEKIYSKKVILILRCLDKEKSNGARSDSLVGRCNSSTFIHQFGIDIFKYFLIGTLKCGGAPSLEIVSRYVSLLSSKDLLETNIYNSDNLHVHGDYRQIHQKIKHGVARVGITFSSFPHQIEFCD